MEISILEKMIENELEKLGRIEDEKFIKIDKKSLLNHFLEFEERLDEEYQKIEEIKLKSLQAAMNEEIIYKNSFYKT